MTCARTLLLLVMLAALEAPAAGTDSSARVRLLEQKLKLLDTLLSRTGAREDLGPDDRAILDVAQTLTHVARQDIKETDLDSVNMSLDEALRLIGEVSRQHAARAPGVDRTDYEALRATVDGLHEAFEATVAARGGDAPEGIDREAVEADLVRSADLARGGHYTEATRTLRKAYDPLVTALARLRANETVSHRLVFETPEAELDYELKRLRSNELLVQLMVQEKRPAVSVLKQIEADVAAAGKLKTRSAGEAASADFENALRSAEAANGHLARALRRTGVYVSQ